MKTFLNKNKTIFTVLLSFVIALMFVIGYGLTANANTTVNADPAKTITIDAYVVDAQNHLHPEASFKAGDEFQIQYIVSQNDGVDALDLTLSYDENKFTLDNIVVNADLLGVATPNGDGAGHFVVENATSRNGAAYPDVIDETNGDLLITATFTVKNNVTSSINEISLAAASKAYAIVEPANEEEQAIHEEILIVATSATINLRTDFQFSVEDVTRTYNGASELNEHIIANLITIPQAELDAAENNDIDLPTFIVHWFNGGIPDPASTDITDVTAIANATGSQTNVGARFFSIEVVENDFYNGAVYFEEENNEITLHDARHFYEGEETGDQHTGYYLVSPKTVTIAIDDKTVAYRSFTANEISAFVTNTDNYTVTGIVSGQPDLEILTVDSQYVLSALPGNYSYVLAHEGTDLPITTNYDLNTNYVLTVEGHLTIGKLQLNMETTEYVQFLGDNVEYDGNLHTIAVSYADNAIGQELANALNVVYTGGENGANGRTNVGSSTITATFTINNAYADKYEFVEVDNETKNVKTATLTITSLALTQEQVDALVAGYVDFLAVDNGTENELTITNQAGAYTRDYNGNPVYIGVVVDATNQEQLSNIVRYKVGNTAYTELEAVLANFAGYAKTNAGVYTVCVEFAPTANYAFAQGVDAEYVITLTINKLALTINATATATYGDADAVITIDNGTGWLSGESYATYNTSLNAVKTYVSTDYVQGKNAGTAIVVTWANGAEAALEGILTNYDVTLTKQNGEVAKKVIDLNSEDFEFAGYTGTYDGASHNLTVTIAQAQQGLVTYEITPKAAVKDVVDSGTYTATFTLTDATNYAFADDDNTLEATVAIAAKALTLGVEYTENTATFTLTGFAGEETETVLTGLTFSVDGDALTGNVYETSEKGSFGATVSFENTNYTAEGIDLLAVYELTFDKDCDDTVAGMPQGGFYFAGQAITAPTAVPTRTHYTFNSWVNASEGSTAFDFVSGLSQDATAYAKWNVIEQHTLSYVIVYGDGNASEAIEIGDFYEDDTITYANLPELLEHDWFRTEKWFTNQALTAKLANSVHLEDDTTVYAGYKFNIGLGDVNADGSVNASDITLYRQHIVGGYTMEVVESGNEWATVTANDYDDSLVYFLERVADTNAQTLDAETLGDESLDIRDVSTIRMALVGGYGFAIVEQNGVTGAELAISRNITIDTLQKLFMIAQSGKTVTLTQDMADEEFDGIIANGRSNITINLGGHTITLNSLNIALKDNEVKTITISNGTIYTTEGFSVLAPAGNVVFEDLTVYEAGEQIQLQAASNSLHFNGTVGFYKAPSAPAVVEIPVTTHVVVEAQATLVVAHIEVVEVEEAEEEATEEAPTALKIEVKNEQAAPIIVIGTVEKTGEYTEQKVINYVCYVMNGQAKQYYTSLAEALETGKTVHLVADILPETAVAISGDATIEGHDHKLKANISGNGTVTLNDVLTTNITVAQNGGFAGTLIFNGGVLDTDRPGTDDADAAFYSRNNPNATFKFYDMTISANITKGIKIYNAKSVVIDGCEFDARKLHIIANELNSNIQSLSLVDIQIDNYATDITITDSTFIGAPQGSIAVPTDVYDFAEMADSDTGAAIKIKAEKGMHFGNVTITGNTFEGNYRDIVLGTGPYANQLQTAAATASNGRSAEGLQHNKTEGWTIANNTTDLLAATVAGRGVATLSYIRKNTPFNKYTTHVGNVGEIKGGVAIWTIANAFEKVGDTWYYVENGHMYSVTVVDGKAVLAQVANASAFYTMNGDDRVYYPSLQAAVNAANGETTIYLAMNASGDGVNVPENSNITFDFAGHTYLVDGQNLAGSTGTKTQCFQLLKGSHVTFKNGTLRTTTAKMMIQNYANTTLDNFTVSGEGAPYVSTGFYVVSNNFGSLTVKAGSKILAYGENQIAFDLWYGMSADYDGGVAVTLKAGSEVRGKVEYGAANRTITANMPIKAELTVEDGAIWGGEITLSSNILLDHQFVVDYDLAINLNGKTVRYIGAETLASGLFGVKRGATLTINDTVGTGKVDATSDKIYAAVALTLSGEATTGEKATVIVNGGTLEGYYYGITGNGSRHNTEIIVNNGTLYGMNGTAIYNPQDGLVTINNGHFTGLETAIEMRAGELEINGGVFEALSQTFAITGNGSGTTMQGIIIAISQHTTQKNITVTINGGTFTNGICALAMGDTVTPNAHRDLMNVTINGGTFGTIVHAQNKTIHVNNGNLVINGGSFDCAADSNGLGSTTVFAENYGYVTINGGTFRSSAKYAGRYWTLNIRNDAKTTARMMVKGGEFFEFDPSNPNTDDTANYVVSGYNTYEDDDGNFIVTDKPVGTGENGSGFQPGPGIF